jgi:hypothetical protein
MASRSEASHVQFTNQAGNLTVGNTFNMGGGGRIAIGGGFFTYAYSVLLVSLASLSVGSVAKSLLFRDCE